MVGAAGAGGWLVVGAAVLCCCVGAGGWGWCWWMGLVGAAVLCCWLVVVVEVFSLRWLLVDKSPLFPPADNTRTLSTISIQINFN